MSKDMLDRQVKVAKTYPCNFSPHLLMFGTSLMVRGILMEV